jgi:hypothetical protein
MLCYDTFLKYAMTRFHLLFDCATPSGRVCACARVRQPVVMCRGERGLEVEVHSFGLKPLMIAENCDPMLA